MPRTRVLLRRGFWILLVLAVGLWAWAYFGRLMESTAEMVLAEVFGAEVHIEDLSLSSTGAELSGLTVFSPVTREPCVEFGRVDVGLSPLYRKITRIELVNPNVTVTETEEGTDLAKIFLRPPQYDLVPLIQVKGGALRWQGQGPVQRELEETLRDPLANPVAVESLRIVAQNASQWVLEGSLKIFDSLVVEVSGHGSRNGLAELSLRIPREHAVPIESALVRESFTSSFLSQLDEYSPHGPLAGSLVLRNSPEGWGIDMVVDLLGVDLRPGVFPCTIRNLSGPVRLAGGSLFVEDVVGTHDDTRIRINGVVQDLFGVSEAEFTVRSDVMELSEEMLAAISQHKLGRQLLNALQPGGKFRIASRVRGGPDGPELWHDLELVSASACFHGFATKPGVPPLGFPLSVVDLTGTVHIEPNRVHATDLRGKVISGGDVSVSGEVAYAGGEVTTHIEIRAKDVAVNEASVTACRTGLGDQVADWFDLLKVKGSGDLILTFDGGTEGKGALTIEGIPNNVTVNPDPFPYPFRVRGGRVIVVPGRLELRGLTGTPLAGPVSASIEVEGDIALTREGAPFDLEFRGENIPLEPSFRNACAELAEGRLEEFWSRCNPRGVVDVDTRWARRSQGGEPTWAVDVRAKEVDMQPAPLPMLVRDLEGTVAYRGARDGSFEVRIASSDPLKGQALGGPIQFVGSIRGGEDVPETGTLTAVGDRILLSHREKADGALDVLAELSPAAAENLRKARPEGRIRLRADLDRVGSDWELRKLRVSPDLAPGVSWTSQSSELARDGMSFELPQFARPVIWNGGRVEADFRAKTASWSRVRGFLGDGVIRFQRGDVIWNDETTDITTRGSLQGMPLETLLHPVLPQASRVLLRRWSASGRSEVDLRQLQLSIPIESPADYAIDVVAELGIADGVFGFLGLSDVEGTLNVRLDAGPGTGIDRRRKVVGELRNTSFRFRRMLFQNLSANVLLHDRGLHLRDLEADFAGGRFVRGANHWHFPFLAGDPYEGAVSLQGAQLHRILGEGNPVTRDWQGALDVELRVRGFEAGLNNLLAGGTVHVRDGQLWSIPVFQRLYELGISRIVGQKGPPKFEEGRVDVEIQRGQLRLWDLDLVGPALSLQGQGYLGPQGLDLHLFPMLHVEFPFVDIPLLGDLANWLVSRVEREALSFRFVGPYQDPRIRWDPVSIMPRSLGGHLDRPRTSPMAPRGLPARF